MPNDHYQPQAIVPGRGPVAPAHLEPVQGSGLWSPAIPPANAPSINILGLVKALQRRWTLALVLGLFCAAVVGVGAWLVVPPSQYTARTLLHVKAIKPKIIFPTTETQSDYGTFQRTQVAMIKSRLVLNAALRQPDLGKLEVVRRQVDPVDWLEEGTKVNFPGGSEILEISMSGDDPDALTAAVNAVSNAYVTEVVDVEHGDRLRRHDMLKRLWIKYQDNLKDQRDRLRKLAEAVGSDDKHTLTLKQQYELERHALTQRDLMQVQSELRRAQTELEVLQAKKGADDPPVPVSEEAIPARIESDETTKKLREQIAQLRDRIARASRVIRNLASDPAIRALRLEVEAAEKALNDHWKQMWPVVVKQLQEEARSGRKLGVGPLQEQIVLLTKLEEKLKLELSSLKEESRALNKGTLDLGELQEKIAHADTAAKTIGTEIESLNVELQAPPRIRVFEKAERPRHKDENKKLRVAGMASAGAFAVVLFGISFWEYRARRVGSVDEVVHALGMRIVGALPSLPRRARGGLSGADSPRNRHWHDLLIESVNATRTMLLHTAHLDSLRVIMVTSPNIGEAKTSVSVHLATSLARSGRRTLLVDCDLRRPTAHRLCGVPLEPGLSGALAMRSRSPPRSCRRPWMACG